MTPARRPPACPTAFRRAPHPGRARSPREGTPVRDSGHGNVASRDRQSAPPSRELPRAPFERTSENLRARRLAAVSPASKLCSPRESVHATDRALPSSLRPKDRTADRAGALLGFRPFRAFSATTSGSVDCDDPPAAKPRDRGSPSPAPDDGTVASILRSRPSGTSGGFGWPPSAPPTDAARVRAPLRRAPLPLLPFVGPRQREPPGSIGLQRFKVVVVGRSLVETGQLSWGFLPRTPPPREGVRATPGCETRSTGPSHLSPLHLAVGRCRVSSSDRRSISSPRVRTPRRQGAALPLRVVRAPRRPDSHPPTLR